MSFWFNTHGRKPGTRREQGDTEIFGKGLFILEFLQRNSRGGT